MRLIPYNKKGRGIVRPTACCKFNKKPWVLSGDTHGLFDVLIYRSGLIP
jgi:hypothetical protein